MVLLPQGLNALKQVAKQVGLDLRGAYLNLDGGFDSAHNRKCIFNAGLIPNIPENPRNRKHPKRGRKRLFNAAIHALRMRVERTFGHLSRKGQSSGQCARLHLWYRWSQAPSTGESSAQVDRVTSLDGTLRQRAGPCVDARSLERLDVPRALGLEQSPVAPCVHRC